jgi:hypothetical protein
MTPATAVTQPVVQLTLCVLPWPAALHPCHCSSGRYYHPGVKAGVAGARPGCVCEGTKCVRVVRVEGSAETCSRGCKLLYG